ncbi:ankyrin-1-like [Schistocerca cancellata]|uniref:ankyrin-1-like n=1 Tax=Schistocerca cancellata TaxID=274614 RepID=UPI0021174D94|nr:ankyrin-1-like [Schistocerca cancellata]XP_049776519.1 ankyrin-1-like [Schistocerca cancellata]
MAPSKDAEYKAKVILSWTTLHFAEETESWESVEVLLNGGSSTRDLYTTKRKLKDPLRAPSVVKEICRRGCLQLLRFALSENPDLVHTKLEMSRTLLHVAAQSGSSVAVRCLLDYPVDVNASDGRGVTPLHEAAAHCDAHVLMLLLKAGANAQARDIDGRTALHYAASGGSASGIRILLAEGLTPDVESANGCSPLHEAASSSNHHCVQLLLNAGADLHMTTNAGWTALHWAANKGTVRSLRMLLEAGIQPGVRTHQDETPLHLAAERGHSDMVTHLVNYGADVEALDSDGRTPAKRASDYIQKQQQEEAAAAASVKAAAAKKVEETKQHRRQRETGQNLAAPPAEETNTELLSNVPHSEDVQGDDSQLYYDEVEGSEYSFQSESEISGQIYSDNGSDFEEENYSSETASVGAPAYNKPPPLLSVETNIGQYGNQNRGRYQRGKYRGRGRGYFRGHKSGSRGGGHLQSQEGKPEQTREYKPSSDRAQNAGYVQQGEHRHRQRHRPHRAKEGEAKREYNNQSSSSDTRRKEHVTYPVGEDTKMKHPVSKDRQKHPSGEGHVPQNMVQNTLIYTTGEDAKMKHPFSKDRQKHPSDERYGPQNTVPNTGTRNLQRREAHGSTDQINRQGNRSGGTFLDELRYLQEKLASVDAGTTQSPKPVPPPKPKPPPRPQL